MFDFEREERRQRVRGKHWCEKETSVGCLWCTPSWGCSCNLGICPDWESKLQCFGVWMMLQPTEPPSKGPGGFHSQNLWGILFPALGWKALCGARTHHFSEGTSAVEVSISMFNSHVWVWDQFIPHFCPSYQSQCGLCVSLVIGLLFN